MLVALFDRISDARSVNEEGKPFILLPAGIFFSPSSLITLNGSIPMLLNNNGTSSPCSLMNPAAESKGTTTTTTKTNHIRYYKRQISNPIVCKTKRTPKITVIKMPSVYPLFLFASDAQTANVFFSFDTMDCMILIRVSSNFC